MGDIPGLVYRGIGLVNEASGGVVDGVLARFGRSLELSAPGAGTDAALAALNGLIGDRLVAAGSPLAIPMRLRRGGRPLPLERAALADALPRATGRLLILVHGLCASDHSWCVQGEGHGTALERELGWTSLYLHYNSGRHVSENGRACASLLGELIDAWPVLLTEVGILAHSMGGLVVRSACHYAALAGHRWGDLLRRIVFLGTPHHGAPLERAGNALQALLGAAPYTPRLARVAGLRSAGITDLRHGNLVDEDWHDCDPFAPDDRRRLVPLPRGVSCYALAASVGRRRGDLGDRFLGDGLVPVASALGRHRNRSRTLPIPESNRCVRYGGSHWGLLNDPVVYARLRAWLG